MTEARHPGRVLKDNYLDPLGITAAELSRGIGVHQSRLTRLIQGRIPLTLDTAVRLGLFFDVPARWWLDHQTQFDLATTTLPVALGDVITAWTGVDDAVIGPRRARFLRAPAVPDVPPEDLVNIKPDDLARMRKNNPSVPAAGVVAVRREDGSLALESHG